MAQMTVQQLIDALQNVQDKTKIVYVPMYYGGSYEPVGSVYRDDHNNICICCEYDDQELQINYDKAEEYSEC